VGRAEAPGHPQVTTDLLRRALPGRTLVVPA